MVALHGSRRVGPFRRPMYYFSDLNPMPLCQRDRPERLADGALCMSFLCNPIGPRGPLPQPGVYWNRTLSFVHGFFPID